MGAWGTGIFENDSALDFLSDIMEITNLKAYFLKSLNDTIETDYLDADLGSEVLAIAALIDASINGTNYQELTDEYPDILEQLKQLNLDSLKTLTVQALQIVISDISELNELWLEQEDDYETFKSDVINLIERMK